MKETIGVAMSGGVDSSFTAAYFLNQGYQVIGITMQLFDSQQAHIDAKIVADFLGIEHHVLDLREDFQSNVVKYFCDEYSQTRTPNPCVKCNEYIKFGKLFDFAMNLGVDYFATGHYARIEDGFLKKAKVLDKDQSYFLYRVDRDKLPRIKFPLGSFSKSEVRRQSELLNLPVASKKDSQEICFIPNDDYKKFLESRIDFKPGAIISTHGKILGKHLGLANYTIGQRRGLGIANPDPLYVVRLNAESNSVIVGANSDLFSTNLHARDLKFLTSVENEFRASVKTRSSRRESMATVSIENDIATVEFDEPQRAVTPGQSVVFYDSDIVLGGGIIY